MNLPGISYYDVGIPFADLMKQADWWSAKTVVGGNPATVHQDSDGWLTSLDSGTYAQCIVQIGSHFPTGRYVVLYSGDAGADPSQTFSVFGGTVVSGSHAAGRFEIDITTNNYTAVGLSIFYINPANPIKNIKWLLPGSEVTYSEAFPWNQDFIDLLGDVRVIRFMDWGQTNNSTLTTWSSRPTGSSRTYATLGAPIEAMILLANYLHVDIWYCVPVQADDNYVTEAATLIRDTLNSDLRLYLEYSNENWNFGFLQAIYCNDQGKLPENWGAGNSEAWMLYSGWRGGKIMDLASAVFSPNNGRLIRVIGLQNGWPYISSVCLDAAHPSTPLDKAHSHFDVAAVAPYFGVTVQDDNINYYLPRTTDQVLDDVEAQISWMFSEPLYNIVAQPEMITSRGLEMIAYEGGQGSIGIQSASTNQTITDLLVATNRSPRMRGIYTNYLAEWDAVNGGLFCQFTLIGAFGRYGCWGLQEDLGQDPATAYKRLGWLDWVGGPI